MNQNQADVELTTAAGLVIKVKPGKYSCIVFKENRPEIPKSEERSMEQLVPSILFIGAQFEMAIPVGQFVLVANRNFRLQVPYRRLPNRTVRHLTLATTSASDQFPVIVQHYDSARTFHSRDGSAYRFIVADDEVPRVDLVALKVKNHDAQILILHPEEKVAQKTADVDISKIRARDLVASGAAAEEGGNPVFLARIHLRNLDLDRVKELVVAHPMTGQENTFIRTFLQLMIKNEHGKQDLALVKGQLEQLDELYRLIAQAEASDRSVFDAELDHGVAKEVAGDLVRYMQLRRSKAANKEQEILYWEWEYRLTKSATS